MKFMKIYTRMNRVIRASFAVDKMLFKHSRLPFIGRLQWCLSKLREEVILRVVPAMHWLRFNSIVYLSLTTVYKSRDHNHRVFGWEQSALEQHWPAEPGRILVPASGGGREINWLLKRGYEVAAFEPVLDLVQFTRETIKKDGLVALEVGNFQDYIRGELTRVQEYAPYQGVVLGWCSISHISKTEIIALLKAVNTMCQQGPILLSWLCRDFGRSRTGRRHRVKKFLGQHGIVKSFGPASYYAGLLVNMWTFEEVEQMAQAAGYTMVMSGGSSNHEENYPHAVLIPNQSTQN